ncbi:MerR family transcriptional regulator [Pseudonocardia sp. ICBG1293]|uniref:helix-turn-helix domain-containing protein n=1 Tax=Pseudonocardia sp. ICBG1293 TaxID=2844382 RepID=UPI001CCA07E5|nr:MerR family transcriptional regulator [Pseudonocardia sp. ICBG1293]
MTWSIRELAAAAGVTPRAVRHYNDIGLLNQPGRLPNGHKRYGTTHLARLRQIKHLTDLGFDLARIAAMSHADPAALAKTLDGELAATIRRLQEARTELDRMLHAGPTVDFVAPASAQTLTRADRSFVVVLSRVLGPRQWRAYTDMISSLPPDPAGREFERLAADADERTRRDLAGRMVGYVREIHRRHPDLIHLYADAPRGGRIARRAVAVAASELYNPAQQEVMAHLRAASTDMSP